MMSPLLLGLSVGMGVVISRLRHVGTRLLSFSLDFLFFRASLPAMRNLSRIWFFGMGVVCLSLRRTRHLSGSRRSSRSAMCSDLTPLHMRVSVRPPCPTTVYAEASRIVWLAEKRGSASRPFERQVETMDQKGRPKPAAILTPSSENPKSARKIA